MAFEEEEQIFCDNDDDEKMKSRALWSLCIGLNKSRIFLSAHPLI